MKLNSWSHATYTLLAAGCYLSDSRDGNEESREKAQEEFMKVWQKNVSEYLLTQLRCQNFSTLRN